MRLLVTVAMLLIMSCSSSDSSKNEAQPFPINELALPPMIVVSDEFLMDQGEIDCSKESAQDESKFSWNYKGKSFNIKVHRLSSSERLLQCSNELESISFDAPRNSFEMGSPPDNKKLYHFIRLPYQNSSTSEENKNSLGSVSIKDFFYLNKETDTIFIGVKVNGINFFENENIHLFECQTFSREKRFYKLNDIYVFCNGSSFGWAYPPDDKYDSLAVSSLTGQPLELSWYGLMGVIQPDRVFKFYYLEGGVNSNFEKLYYHVPAKKIGDGTIDYAQTSHSLSY